eukprot:SAG31_NODE_2354_length_5881_cov_7.980111_4_plen_234_part_00
MAAQCVFITEHPVGWILLLLLLAYGGGDYRQLARARAAQRCRAGLPDFRLTPRPMHCSTRLAVLANFLGCSFIAISLLTRNTQLCHVQNEQVARSVESEHAHVNLPASATYLRGRHAAGFEDHVYSDLYIKHINDIKHMEKQVATGRTWRAHVAKVLQLPHVDEMRCGAGLLENLHFKKATPPRHFLPARRGNAHLSIFAELESDTCNLLGRDTKTGQTGCDKIESGARSGTG